MTTAAVEAEAEEARRHDRGRLLLGGVALAAAALFARPVSRGRGDSRSPRAKSL